MSTLTVGKAAEQAACHYLEQHNLQCITQNYRCRLGEIDLIMQDHQELVFVEVRYRGASSLADSLESITTHKQRRIIKAAEHYLMTQQINEQQFCRFDVVGIDAEHRITWIRDAFQT